MEQKTKIYLEAIGYFFLLWIAVGIAADIIFAILGLGELARLSGLLGVMVGAWYAWKKYKEGINKLNKKDNKQS